MRRIHTRCVTLDDLLVEARALERALDRVVESARDPVRQAWADWAWYRFVTVNVLVRERGAGPLAASIARSLLEEAVYWDFGLAHGDVDETIVCWAASEYRRLTDLALEVDDAAWVGWLLPPGAELISPGGEIPRNPGDAVRRIGRGFDGPVLEPLRYRGLLATNRILDLLTHGNLAAALAMAPGGGAELPTPLAAAVVHVAAVSSTALVGAQLPGEVEDVDVNAIATGVADAASALHGLVPDSRPNSQLTAKTVTSPPIAARSEIETMPEAPSSLTEMAKAFVEVAHEVGRLAVEGVRFTDAGARTAWASFQMSYGQLDVVLGTLDGTLGRALVPFAGRMLLEDGARWEWLRLNAIQQPTGNSLRALVAESKRYAGRVIDAMTSEGVPRSRIDALLGDAVDLLLTEPGDFELPLMPALLTTAYPNASGIDSARVMYSVLSQFVHATPVVMWHLRRGTFHSITAPMYAIAIDAACRGFTNVAVTTLTIACDRDERLDVALRALREHSHVVRYEASRWHLLG